MLTLPFHTITSEVMTETNYENLLIEQGFGSNFMVAVVNIMGQDFVVLRVHLFLETVISSCRKNNKATSKSAQ